MSIPVATTVFPGEQYQAPRSWLEKAYPNLIYFNEVDKGGTSPHGNNRSSSPRSYACRLPLAADTTDRAELDMTT